MSNMQEFLINNRFLINPALNQVQDIAREVKIRIEPRIMQVLTILAANSGKIVTREELIKEIWNDYGGADEGLTQAISFLRKVVDDHSREIIRTIPKKGYLLQASVTQSDLAGNVAKATTYNSGFKYLYLVIGIIAVTIGAVLYGFYFHQNQAASNQPASTLSTETAFPLNNEEDDTNPLTTITTTDSLGNRYRLIMIGDQRPKFYVNDSLQLNQEPYDALINKLAKQLWKRQEEAENK